LVPFATGYHRDSNNPGDRSQRPLDDTTAYMMLVTCSTQGELTALERGLHALRSGMSVRDYASASGGKPTWVAYQRQAAEVFTRVNSAADLSERTKHLVEIYAAPAWLWPALVAAMLPSTRPMGEVLVDPSANDGPSVFGGWNFGSGGVFETPPEDGRGGGNGDGKTRGFGNPTLNGTATP
jgi:hypothetical protein